MNREKCIRAKFYSLLASNLTYDSGVIPVHDAALNDEENNIYVLLTTQRANMSLNNCMNSWECEQDLEIYSRQHQTVSKDIIDDVAEQIEDLIYAGLSAGSETNGWQLNNVYLSSSDNNAFDLTPTKSIVSKFLTYRLQATKI